jgi:hypothetical protein
MRLLRVGLIISFIRWGGGDNYILNIFTLFNFYLTPLKGKVKASLCFN